MIESTITGHGRFHELGGIEPVPVYGALYPGLAGQLNPWVGGVYNPAHWAYEVGGYPGNETPLPPGTSGLLQAIPGPYGNRILGIRALGSGTLNFDILLSPAGVWVGGAGEEIQVGASVGLNGVLMQSQMRSFYIPGWVLGILQEYHFVGTIDVVAGDELTAGLITNKTPAIYAYSSGTGFGTRMFVNGWLAADEFVPGQPPLRLHGAVAGEY